jgi:hypothetical protein
MNKRNNSSNFFLTHEQGTNNNGKSEVYQEGYRDGYWHLQKNSNDSEYLLGYKEGYTNYSLDRN